MPTAEQMWHIFPKESEIPPEWVLHEPEEQSEYLIGGELRRWSGPREKVYSPICLLEDKGPAPKYLGSYPLLTRKEALEALSAAVEAYDSGQGVWPTMPVKERIQHMERFAYCLSQKRDAVVKLLMWEIGKSTVDSAAEFDRTVKYIRDTIDALKELDRNSSRFVIDSGIVAQIRRAPLGVTLCMGPFNYPLNETFTTLIPALLMGNTALVKPAKFGVLLNRPLLEAFRDCFPKGVVNFVYGDGREVISPLMQSGQIDALAFIGSSRVADLLKMQHPKLHRLRAVLGLGAKNPAIILPSADLDLAVRECILGTLSFNGQRCTALKILFVHRSVADVFVSKFCESVLRLPFGMPWIDKVAITPLPEPGKPEILADYVSDAEKTGARVVNPGGGAIYKTFFYPAVLYPVNSRARIYHEEQFGPLVPIVPFSSIEEPTRYIIESVYGQQLSIFGSESTEIAKLLDPAVNQVCRVNLNSQCQRGPDTFPFTGRKDSAYGTLSVSDALKVFSIRTLVAAKLNDLNKTILNDIVNNHRSKFLSHDFIL